MATFRLDGDLLHIGEGTIEVRTLIDWLDTTGTLEAHDYLRRDLLEDYGYMSEGQVEHAEENAREQALEEAADDWRYKVDSALDELTYLDHDEDPYRYHDDNKHTGAVAYCPDAFCASAGRTETAIDILRGA